MYYVDSQRTLTRRESSLIAISEGDDTTRTRSTTRFRADSVIAFAPPPRPNGSVRKELITGMFESMLDCIIESWEIILPPVKTEDILKATETLKTPSETTIVSKRTKKSAKEPVTSASGKNSRTKKSRSSKLELIEQTAPLHQSWWSGSDERAIIRFKNGNVYEGNISMKCMHGEGRFQWADGTVYLGQFNDNEIRGKGMIQWKNDTWYEGEFAGNLRHGLGLYVDSRARASYSGEWNCGAKHGHGRSVYSSFLDTNTYDGDWENNVQHGFGSREYSTHSGYKGQWDFGNREGNGLMIWHNHDFYKGCWKNNLMSGYGMYIWNACSNNTMSLSSLKAYRGQWLNGERNGYGVLDLGFGLGSHYKGGFKDNKKHGPGKLVTNNGMVLKNSKMLFFDDNLGPMTSELDESRGTCPHQSSGPFVFNMCDDDTVRLVYHIKKIYQNIDRELEIRTTMVEDYFKLNQTYKPKVLLSNINKPEIISVETHATALVPSEDVLKFEEDSLHNAVKNYETDVRHIYNLYSTICNTEEIYFAPIMTRLYLWQFYNDCNVHEKGLCLVDIDRMLHENPEMLVQNPHDPFEKIYYWQFLHSLISVSSKLYGKRQLPGIKPDTILANAFRSFMEMDAIPARERSKGVFVNGYGSFVPLMATYRLYQSLGEPHTVRRFLCASRQAAHCALQPPEVVDSADEATPIGRNAYIFGDEMTFVTEDPVTLLHKEEKINEDLFQALKLSNFGNLTTKCIIDIFSLIFPQLYYNGKIMSLDIELTFFEFFEAFIACALKSVSIKEGELKCKEKFSASNNAVKVTAQKRHKIT